MTFIWRLIAGIILLQVIAANPFGGHGSSLSSRNIKSLTTSEEKQLEENIKLLISLLQGLLPVCQNQSSVNKITPTSDFEKEIIKKFPNDGSGNSAPTIAQPKYDRNVRAAVRACQRFRDEKGPALSDHILGGTVAEIGEFPHMVAILYGDRMGKGPYVIRCGGTLISERFVLTAAHCVATLGYGIPSFVRMGVTNFTDPEELINAVEIKIKDIQIPRNYTTRRSYNDIAIIELDKSVQFTAFIYPACLHTDVADPGQDIECLITGWGVTNTTTEARSNVLLRASLHVTPLQECQARHLAYGLASHCKEGIKVTQLCAEDKDMVRDSCSGDSGGPLQLLINERKGLYSVVGVTSAGNACGSSTPALYTRVASFLDWIESKVWPNRVQGQTYATIDEVTNDIFHPGSNIDLPPLNERPALRACRRILKGLKLNQSHHILQGTSAELGQFPHLVALGYARNDAYGEFKHDFRCAGALIDSRFVLTAAQCVRPITSPFIVRLGVVNINDPNEMTNAVDIPIKKIHRHKNYSRPSLYNDIAIVELERPVEYSEYIYPICLNVDVADPDPKDILWITGWGAINRKPMPDARKSPVVVTPLETCRIIYKDIEGSDRARQGLITSQLCAKERYRANDAGVFIAGAVLNLILDASYKNYRLVGVVSAGFLDAQPKPDVYTGVAAFLDFIEEIVWPNEGN